ncbi:MAG TPA: ornithine cyclodeaminase family protein [Casimicrobiaceae bacterium]|nr:ornithine cyclodeaminase family protein [Casimicrobiaceae bacterium]
MRYIGPADIARLHAEGVITMTDYVEAIHAVYRDKGEGGVQVVPRANLWAEENRPGTRPRSLKIAGALTGALGVMGTVAYSAGYGGGGIDLWIQLFSTTTGEAVALLHGGELSLWKTGATAAVAARAMSRPESGVVAIIGTGRFARTQLTGLMAVRTITELRCYSRGESGREAFAQWAKSIVGDATVRATASAREAVEAADIVVTVTTSRSPALEGAWLAPGTHCNAVGMHYPDMREIDTFAVQRSRVIVDDIDQALQEKGELLIPLRAGDIGREHILGELGDVLCGRVQARDSREAITLFCSGGVAIEQLASCAMVARKAGEAGIGALV